MCQVKGRILKGWKMANQDEWYCGNDFFCAATNDERSCYYCMATMHLIANCPDKQNRKPAHPNFVISPI